MNSLTKKSGFRFLALLLITIISIAATAGSGDNECPSCKKPVADVSDSINTAYPILKKEFGKNKKMPSRYERQILYALSYFPELKNTKIEFRIKKSSGGIISTRPSIGSLLRKSNKRTYIVVINDSIAGRTLPSFSGADVNGQVGILGHEFCHIVDFNHQTGLSLMGLGVSHVSNGFMDRFEYKTDSMNIERGLGHQLLAWKQYLDKGFAAMRPNNSPPSQKTIVHERYMSVEQIRWVMAKSKAYQETK